MKPAVVKSGKGKVFQAMVPGTCEKLCRLWGPGGTAGGTGGDLSAGRHVVEQTGQKHLLVSPEQCRAAESMNPCWQSSCFSQNMKLTPSPSDSGSSFLLGVWFITTVKQGDYLSMCQEAMYIFRMFLGYDRGSPAFHIGGFFFFCSWFAISMWLLAVFLWLCSSILCFVLMCFHWFILLSIKNKHSSGYSINSPRWKYTAFLLNLVPTFKIHISCL